MKRLLVLTLVTACGSAAPKPAPAPAPEPTVEPALVGEEVPAPEPPPAPPEPPAPPAPPPVPLTDRLHDEGPVAGMEGWTLKRTADENYCTGFKVTTVRGKKKIAPENKPLADVYAIVFPADLRFDPGHKEATAASLEKFDEWVQKSLATSKKANESYEAKLAPGGDMAEAIRATARIAQIDYRFASVLARAPIPKGVRTGEFKADMIAAYCDKMAAVAEPIAARADEALAVCAKKIDASSTDWPKAFCTP